SRDAILTLEAPKPASFLSQAVRNGGNVYCSGQVGLNPTTGKLVEGTVQDRTRQIMNNLAAVRQAAGSDLSSVVKVNIFLTDLADFAALNEVYEGFFGDPKPARTCVGVQSLPLGTDVEIECIAKVAVPKLC
ncbi:protein mmf2, mitochondrial precursor, partial [Macrophomina phaseolina]